MVSAPTVLLIHSPLVGPSTWHPCAERFRQMGYEVVAPSLFDALIAGPPYYERMADRFAAAIAPAAKVVAIVAHSGAGALVPAVAERVDARCYGIFVDAILPHPGRSWLETAPPRLVTHLHALARSGILPQWDRWFPAGTIETLLPDSSLRKRFVSELPQVAVGYLTEKAPAAAVDILAGSGYLRLSGAYEDMAAHTEQLGWPVQREAVNHLAILTRPEMVCAAIVRLFEALNLSSVRR